MVGNPDFNIGSEAAEFQEIQTPEGELYLRFYISSGDEFALPATGIREVIEAGSEEITPIPNVSPFLLGTLNLRGRVIWVADLGQLLGDVSPLKTDRSEIPVIAVDTHIFRLANRINLAKGKTPLEVEKKLTRFTPDEFLIDAHHLLILHGRYVCKAQKPDCSSCCIYDFCEYKKKLIKT